MFSDESQNEMMEQDKQPTWHRRRIAAEEEG